MPALRAFGALTLLLLSTALLAAGTYYCPMHCEKEKTYPGPGKCPVCGMDLVPTEGGSKDSLLSSLDYRVDLVAEGAPTAGKPTSVKAIMRQTVDNKAVTQFAQPPRMVVVSQDLHWLARPASTATGEGEIKATFELPEPGDYIVYLQATPQNGSLQVFPLALQVPGPRKPAKPLEPTASTRAVQLDAAPVARKALDLKFRIKEKGLTPMHLLAVSEDTTEFLAVEPKPGAKPGTFAVEFPRAGRWKLWLISERKGKEQVADFVVKVKPAV